MADFEVEKEYSEQLRKLETTDPAHADLFNSMFSTLINNDAYLNEQNNKIKQPEFDDSGSVDEIKDFPSFLSSMVSRMSIFKFFSDLKAGLKFVLHTGQIVNNCVTDRSDLPGSAHNDKVLMDKYLALSSDLNNTYAVLKAIRILTLTKESTGTFDYKYIQAKETAIGIHFECWLEAKTALSKGEWFITFMSDLRKTISYVTAPFGSSGTQSAIMYQTTAGCFNIRLHQDAPAGTAFYLSVFLPVEVS